MAETMMRIELVLPVEMMAFVLFEAESRLLALRISPLNDAQVDRRVHSVEYAEFDVNKLLW